MEGANFANFLYSRLTPSIKNKLDTNSSLDYWIATLSAQGSQKAKKTAFCKSNSIDETTFNPLESAFAASFNARVEELFNEQFPKVDESAVEIPSDIDELEKDMVAPPTRVTSAPDVETTMSGPSARAVPVKKEVDDSDDISEEEHEKPKAPRAPVAPRAPAPVKEAPQHDWIENTLDYKTIDLDADVINGLYEAIHALQAEQETETPLFTWKTLEITKDDESKAITACEWKEADSKYSKLLEKELKYRILSAKVQTNTLTIKYGIEYVDGDKLKTTSVSVKYIANDVYEAATEFTELERAMFDSFKDYVALFTDKWCIENIEPALSTDAVINMKAVLFDGILDSTRNLPIGPYKIAYEPEKTPEYEFREADYVQLFKQLRRTGQHYSSANLVRAMVATFKLRSLIVHHDAVKTQIDKWWTDAFKAISAEEYNENEIALKWRMILSSATCKLVIAKGWPARPEFEKYIKGLIKFVLKWDEKTVSHQCMPTAELMVGPLFPISFIFGPFAVAMKRCPLDAKTLKFVGASIDKYMETLGAMTPTYSECNWCLALIDGLENTDKKSIKALFLLSLKHLGRK